MKTRIYNIIILDESGSMEHIKRMAVNGCNETIQTIRAAQRKYEETQQHYLTLVTFNTEMVNTLYDKRSIDAVIELTTDDYRPEAGTPLYDAMGMTFCKFLYGREETEEDRVLVTVITDGEENSSREYTGQMIKKMVDELKTKGWLFAYIGANQDTERIACSLSIENTLNFRANEEETEEMFKKERICRARFYDRVEDKEIGCCLSHQTGYFDEK